MRVEQIAQDLHALFMQTLDIPSVEPPKGQYSGAGRSIDYSEIQPGDIICYSSNGGKSCTHVALYIGDGQIVHAANSRKGVIVGEADYSPIIGVKNVID